MIIAEDLLLLTYDDESGAADPWIDQLDLRLAGALLVELAILGRVEITAAAETLPDGTTVKRGRVVVRDASPAGHPELDSALALIGTRPRKPESLIEPLSKGLRDRLLAGLAERGILRRETKKVLRLFPITRWPAADLAHEAALIERLRSVLVEGVSPTPSEAAIVALAKGTNLIKTLVGKEHRKIAAARAKELRSGAWAADAAQSAIDSVNAVMVAVIMTTVVASSSRGGYSGGGGC